MVVSSLLPISQTMEVIWMVGVRGELSQSPRQPNVFSQDRAPQQKG